MRPVLEPTVAEIVSVGLRLHVPFQRQFEIEGNAILLRVGDGFLARSEGQPAPAPGYPRCRSQRPSGDRGAAWRGRLEVQRPLMGAGTAGLHRRGLRRLIDTRAHDTSRCRWSGRRDRNPRPPVLKTGALTRLRHAPLTPSYGNGPEPMVGEPPGQGLSARYRKSAAPPCRQPGCSASPSCPPPAPASRAPDHGCRSPPGSPARCSPQSSGSCRRR